MQLIARLTAIEVLTTLINLVHHLAVWTAIAIAISSWLIPED